MCYYFSVSAPRLLTVLCILSSATLLTCCTNDHLTDFVKKNNSSTDTVSTTPNNKPTTSTSGSTSTAPATPSTTPTPAAETVSFATNIKPILAKYQCANCHGSYYEAYSTASSLARSGQLYGMMSWSSGYRRMPPRQKATDAELTLISNWIKQGALNN